MTITNPTERRIASKLVKHALASGYVISVYDGEEFALKLSASYKAIMEELGATDEETLVIRDPASILDGQRLPALVGKVALIHGNGIDLISDWAAARDTSEAFDAWMKPVTDYVETLDV